MRNGHIYVFNADQACFSSAIFTTYMKAEAWIQHHYLSGILTEYPVDVGCYDWAIENGHFKDKSPIDRSPVFIGKFISAHQKNWHFKHGDLLGNNYFAIHDERT